MPWGNSRGQPIFSICTSADVAMRALSALHRAFAAPDASDTSLPSIADAGAHFFQPTLSRDGLSAIPCSSYAAPPLAFTDTYTFQGVEGARLSAPPQ